MYNERWTSRLIILLSVAVVIWIGERAVPLLQTFSDVLALFFLAWLTAFVLEPVVTFLEGLRVPRALAVTGIYLLLLIGLGLLGLLIVPPLVNQLGQLSDGMGQLVQLLPTEAEVSAALARLGITSVDLSAIYRPERLAQQLQASAGPLLQGVLTLAASAVTVVVQILMLLIISYYMLLDGRKIVRAILRVLPRQSRQQALIVLLQVSASFGGFLRGQIVQALLFGGAVALVLFVVGLDFAWISAASSALLMLIPIIGPMLALIPPLALNLGGEQAKLAIVLAVLAPLQLFVVNVLMPRILSGQIGMPPLLVFLAILLGLRIGGPLGAFFGIPIMGAFYGTAVAVFNRWKSSDEGRSAEAAAGR